MSNERVSEIEKEILALRAVYDAIDGMVNNEIMRLHHNDPDSEIRFNSRTHQKFFSIAFVDFLSRPLPDPFQIGAPFGRLCRQICPHPHFDRNGSAAALVALVGSFHEWLRTEVVVHDVWMPSIDLKINLRLRREEFLKICGDISKHNFTRLNRRAEDVRRICARSGSVLSLEESILALDNFYEWFHDDIFLYHSSTIAEFLNNIRHAIHEYPKPEFASSFVQGEPPNYSFTHPPNVENPLAKACYWSLMNEMRSKPYMPKFVVTKYLKTRY